MLEDPKTHDIFNPSHNDRVVIAKMHKLDHHGSDFLIFRDNPQIDPETEYGSI